MIWKVKVNVFVSNLNIFTKTALIPSKLLLFCRDKCARRFRDLINSPTSVVLEKFKGITLNVFRTLQQPVRLGTVVKLQSLIFQLALSKKITTQILPLPGSKESHKCPFSELCLLIFIYFILK